MLESFADLVTDRDSRGLLNIVKDYGKVRDTQVTLCINDQPIHASWWHSGSGRIGVGAAYFSEPGESIRFPRLQIREIQ